jgi:3-hydroxyisobutyrate dehydrogenase-like beta-hydroxyacid dehydrogenase
MTLGFLGLGIMGYPMARNLLRAGHSVAVWSNTTAKARRLVEAEKAEFCATPKQVAEAAEIVFLCVGDTAMSERVTLGPDGILDGVRAGSIVADCSTVAPSYARRAAAALAEKGAHFLDTPVTGSKPGAEGGTLTIMVGGDAAIYEKLKPYLEPLGKLVYYCGGIGLGLHAKLTQNLILSNLLQAFNEGLVLATRAGVDPELMIEILNNSAARSGMISFKAPYVLRRDFSTNFSTRWMHKDLGLMLETGAELGVPLPLTGLTRQLVQVAISEGYADEDMCSTIKVLEKIAGVEVKSISKKS